LRKMASMAGAPEESADNQESSFGIRKIVDCKTGEDGRQFYKVKWEPTWEPADNLASCQHLIDEFWSFVNRVKAHEQRAVTQHRKRPRLDSSGNVAFSVDEYSMEAHRLGEDSKADIQRLINRTQGTTVPTLVSPSAMLNSTQNNGQAMSSSNNQFGTPPRIPNQPGQMNQNMMQSPGGASQFGNSFSPQQSKKGGGFGKQAQQGASAKPESDDTGDAFKNATPKGALTGNSLATYLDNFSHPYVKLVIVCKGCNKEQKLSLQRNWKRHYLSCTGGNKDSYPCGNCGKSFTSSTTLQKHSQNCFVLKREDF